MEVGIVAAYSVPNRTIGNRGDLPWKDISEIRKPDLANFKRLTMGHWNVMGRETWESIPEKYRPLPGRTNVVLTSNTNYIFPEGVLSYNNLLSVLEQAKLKGQEKLFLIGGEGVYRSGIEFADVLYLTEIHQDFTGDRYFPDFSRKDWFEKNRERHDLFDFVEYRRVRKS